MNETKSFSVLLVGLQLSLLLPSHNSNTYSRLYQVFGLNCIVMFYLQGSENCNARLCQFSRPAVKQMEKSMDWLLPATSLCRQWIAIVQMKGVALTLSHCSCCLSPSAAL